VSSEAPYRPAWHALLGPLPADAVPDRQPVASAEVLAGPTGWAVAGWEQLVVLDASGVLLSASDAVLYRTGLSGGPPPADGAAPTVLLQLSVGGRFEADGSFHGTRWHSVAVESGREEEPEWESTPSAPSADDVEGLQTVVAEMIRRGPPPS
jgi:hypothetical protein